MNSVSFADKELVAHPLVPDRAVLALKADLAGGPGELGLLQSRRDLLRIRRVGPILLMVVGQDHDLVVEEVGEDRRLVVVLGLEGFLEAGSPRGESCQLVATRRSEYRVTPTPLLAQLTSQKSG